MLTLGGSRSSTAYCLAGPRSNGSYRRRRAPLLPTTERWPFQLDARCAHKPDGFRRPEMGPFATGGLHAQWYACITTTVAHREVRGSRMDGI